jgi:glycosyltransferase involved in cell wall biosynthesis
MTQPTKSAAEVALSVVVPLYNEEESIGPLYEAIAAVLDAMPQRWEIVFVDDGSTDSTFAKIEQLHRQDARVRCVKFRRNYGQTPAMQAGFDHARGAIVVSMDGDLQNDPADIPRLLAKIDEGYGVVCGWRKDRKDNTVTRTIPSKIANWLISRMTGVAIHDTGCSLKAYRAELIKGTRLYAEMHRFIPAMASMSGTRITEIVVTHHARKFGQSKYGLFRVWQVASDLLVIKMLTGFSRTPATWYGLLSIPFLLATLASGAVTGWLYLQAVPGEDFPIVLPGATFLFAVAFLHFAFLGLLTELIVSASRVHDRQVFDLDTIDGS